MEYDNDRKINPPHNTEIFYWIVFVILCPLINAVTFFWYDPLFWPALLITSIVTLPLYVLYSRSVVPVFLFEKRPVAFGLASICAFVFIQAILLGINAIISLFPLSPPEEFFVSFAPRAVAGNLLWGMINIFLAVTIAFLKKLFD